MFDTFHRCLDTARIPLRQSQPPEVRRKSKRENPEVRRSCGCKACICVELNLFPTLFCLVTFSVFKIILQDRVAKYAESLQPWIKDKNTFDAVSIILFLV